MYIYHIPYSFLLYIELPAEEGMCHLWSVMINKHYNIVPPKFGEHKKVSCLLATEVCVHVVGRWCCSGTLGSLRLVPVPTHRFVYVLLYLFLQYYGMLPQG